MMKKRFIAGAVCPTCSQQDSLRWWVEQNIEWVECVECHFSEQRKPKSVEQSEHGREELIGIFKPQ